MRIVFRVFSAALFYSAGAFAFALALACAERVFNTKKEQNSWYLWLFDFDEFVHGVVVGIHTLVIHFFESHNYRVACARLVHRSHSAQLVRPEPVRQSFLDDTQRTHDSGRRMRTTDPFSTWRGASDDRAICCCGPAKNADATAAKRNKTSLLHIDISLILAVLKDRERLSGYARG